MPINPNKAFAAKNGKLWRPEPRNVVMIRCEATNCGNKTIVSRDLWISDEDIICNRCGAREYWEPL